MRLGIFPSQLSVRESIATTASASMPSEEELKTKESPAITEISFETVICHTETEWDEACQRTLTANTVGIDFETTGLDPLVNQVRLIQMALSSEEGNITVYIADVYKLGQKALMQLLPILSSHSTKKVIHNAKFELSFIRKAAGCRFQVENLFDTMLASQLVWGGLYRLVPAKNEADKWKPEYRSHSLEQLALRHLCIKLDKNLQTSDWRMPELTQDQIRYAALDAAILLCLQPILEELIHRNDLRRVSAIEMAVVPVVVEMEFYGLPFHASKARSLKQELEEQAAILEAEICAAAERLGFSARKNKKTGLRDKFNPNSTYQVLRCLQALGHTVDNASEDTLQKLSDDKCSFSITVLAYRKLTKQIGFLKEWLSLQHPFDDRLHGRYQQIQKNNTGRFSCSAPNLQQIPGATKYRELFHAGDGMDLIDADFSAMELRIVAAIANETTMLEAFRENADLHRVTAAALTGKPLDEVTKAERNSAKPANFGLIYGCGVERLIASARNDYKIDISFKEAEQMRKRFFRKYPSIAKYHQTRCRPERQKVIHHRHNFEEGFYAVKVTGTRTATKRLRIWGAHEGKPLATFTTLANTPVQGTGACILKHALSRIYHRLLGCNLHDIRIVATIHDEIILETPTEYADEAAKLLKEEMEAAGADIIPTVPILAEVEVVKHLPGKG